MNKQAFLDTETTGLDPYKHELVEVAIIVRDDIGGGTWRRRDPVHFALPCDLAHASDKALEINRYWERRSELHEAEISHVQARELLTETLEGATVIGNAVSFDLRFIENLLRATPWHYMTLDLKSWVAGICGMSAPASTKLVAEVSGVEIPDGYHSALVDAGWNERVYDALRTR